MYTYKERKHHLAELRNPSAVGADLELLRTKAGNVKRDTRRTRADMQKKYCTSFSELPPVRKSANTGEKYSIHIH